MLLNCNALSADRIKNANDDLKKFSKLINDTRKDLDHIFKKVRTIKSKLATQYPDAMSEAQSKMGDCNLSDGSENDEVVIAEEVEPVSRSASQPMPSNAQTIDRSTVDYVPLRHESEASSSPASNDAIPDRS